jgi:hypothetical protein
LCGGVWITGSKFGVTWKLSQAAVKSPETFEKGKCYVSVCEKTYDSDEETFDMKQMSTVVSETVPVQEQSQSEPVLEPLQEQSQPEPVAEPAQEPAKKKQVKKKDPKEV